MGRIDETALSHQDARLPRRSWLAMPSYGDDHEDSSHYVRRGDYLGNGDSNGRGVRTPRGATRLSVEVIISQFYAKPTIR